MQSWTGWSVCIPFVALMSAQLNGEPFWHTMIVLDRRSLKLSASVVASAGMLKQTGKWLISLQMPVHRAVWINGNTNERKAWTCAACKVSCQFAEAYKLPVVIVCRPYDMNGDLWLLLWQPAKRSTKDVISF